MTFLSIDKSVKLKPYIPRDFKPREYMTDAELINGTGGTLLGDVECYENYFLIAFKDYTTKKVTTFEINADTGECFNERKLSWIMHSYRTVGFNWLKFDLPLIWYAYKNQDTAKIKHIANEIIFQNVFPAAIAKTHGFIIFKTNVVDLIEVCPLRGSLKLYGARLHAPRIQDLPFDIHEPIDESQIEVVKDYCFNDLDTTEILMTNLSEQLQLRENLSIEYKQDLMSKSDAQIAEAVIGSELKRITGKWPSKPEIKSENIHKYIVPANLKFQSDYLQYMLQSIANTDFKLDEYGRLLVPDQIKNLKITIGKSIYRMGIGGLHSSEECVSIKSNDEFKLYDRDVASYYPSIVLNLSLFPQHLGENFSTVYRNIVDRRITAKKAKNVAISEVLKVTINGTFGKTGSPYSFLYAPEMTIQITVGGQLYLLMLIEMLELENIPVVSANTDGVLIYCPQSKEMRYREIIKMWEQQTGFVTEESEYEAIYSRDVNAYMAIKAQTKEVKGKNVYYDPWRGKSARDNYWKFQKNPTTQICIEALEKLIVHNTPIEQTIRECRDFTKFIAVKNVTGGAHKDENYLGKVVRWYYAQGIIGTLNYITSNNKVPDTDGALPCMDLPAEFPNNINYQFYIDKTKEMMYDLAYLKRPKQLQFF